MSIKWQKINYIKFLYECLDLLRKVIAYMDNQEDNVIEEIALIIDEMEMQCQYNYDHRVGEMGYGFADFIFSCIEGEDKLALVNKIDLLEGEVRLNIESQSEDEECMEFYLDKYGDLPIIQVGGGVHSKYKEIEIYYVTDRAEISCSNDFTVYGHYRSSEVSYGLCFVRVPEDARMGEMSEGNQFADDERGLSVKKIIKISGDDLYETMRSSEDILIYVHGYKTSFEKAVMVMAKMCYDLQYKGVSIIYSWPSCNKLLKYMEDKENMSWSVYNMKEFFSKIMDLDEGVKINVISHSMGAAGMLDVILGITGKDSKKRKRIKEFVLAAPDIDVDIFSEKIKELNKLEEDCLPITVYVSRNDWVLRFAYRFLFKYRRVGDISNGVVVLGNVETVDASLVDNGVVGHGHSTFHKSKNMLIDIHYLLEGNRASDRFPLKAISVESGVYWQILQ